jgi:hypothetical protein
VSVIWLSFSLVLVLPRVRRISKTESFQMSSSFSSFFFFRNPFRWTSSDNHTKEIAFQVGSTEYPPDEMLRKLKENGNKFN